MIDVVYEHRVPKEIEQSLDSRYQSEYHLTPAGSDGWKFERKQFTDAEFAVVDDAERLFKSSQRWKAEAIAVGWGKTPELNGKEATFARLTIGLHAEGCTPTYSEGFLLWKREHLVLSETTDEEVIGNNPLTIYKRSARFNLRAGRTIGPLGFDHYLAVAKVPYFISRVDLHPFTYSDLDRTGFHKFTGEDTTRMLLIVVLSDGKQVVRNRMADKLAVHSFNQSEAQRRLGEAQKRVDELAGMSLEALIGSDEAELAYL